MPTPLSAARTTLPWAVVGGIVIVALSMRGPLVAPAPVLGDIQAELGLSTTAVGLLTSLPILCFALATPLATRIIGRAGPEIAVLTCLLGVLLGTIVRSAGNTPVVFAGTVILGAAIAIGNVVVPVIIRRDVPWQRASAVTGAYTAALNVGSMITSLGTAPLAAVVGWRWALATWGVLALGGAAYWMWLIRRRRDAVVAAPTSATAPSADEAATAATQTGRIGWLLLIAFAGQSTAYYSVTTWLPTILADTRGLGAAASGATASLFQIAAIVGALGVPVLAARTPAWVPTATIGLLWVALPIGLLLAPQAYITWSIIGGVAQGGGFTAILSIIARVTRSDREAARMSAKVQAGGYIAATLGPPAAGALNSVTGGWAAPLMLILTATAAYTFGAVGAALAARAHQPAR
ncbi:CynX/NimT family MFS transporter [Georgenia yuyongxinii]|uniref:MFS transporter n=1 Tax=Georgenia yuyongxinii TaxID=2589797 RepID=A0A552WPU0_9MICO|nr:MFS transporter [Georgenia yuyongxinii]TRW44513.1 MFS transporter [Georgenia yuyongxinii]